MKKIITFAMLICMAMGYGQNKVGNKVQSLVSKNTQFRHFSPLIARSGPGEKQIEEVVDKAGYAVVNIAQIREIAAAKYPAIELDIPYNGSNITVQLYRAEVLAQGFHVDTDKSTYVPYEQGAYYRGVVKGDYGSVVSFNFFRDEMNGIISNDAVSNLVVARIEKENNFSDYIIYSDAEMKILNDFHCNTADTDLPEGHTHRDGNSTEDTMSDRCVTVYFEIDYDIFVQKSSSVSLTTDWMTAVFNNVQTLYENDGISVALKSVFVWTEFDPYGGSDSSDYLFQFNDQRPVFDGDVGQLVGIDGGGLGGVAVTIGGVCSDNNFSYSDVDIVYSGVPVYSWTVQVITHELGHLLGSPHTHGCYWNGDNTAIDGCGTQAGYIEGNCPQGPIPSSFTKGTIMSYCHLVSGVGIKFQNGFGEQPAQRILNHVNSRTCLSFDCVNTCINTVTLMSVVSVGMNTATLSWTDDAGGPWLVSFAPFTGNFSTWTPVSENTFTANGLNPNTNYKFAVRKSCPAGVTNNESRQLIFTTAANFCGGVQFTDTGGSGGSYMNNQYYVRIIQPEIAGQEAQVTFTTFNLEQDFDYLYVYNGSSTSAPLIGQYTGTAIPGPFASTAANGALTFVFVSDSDTTRPGWNATISCANLGTSENAFIDFSYYPNPSDGIVNIKAGEQIEEVTVYNVAGQVLLNKKVNSSETAVDISSFAEGVYFFRAGSGTKEVNFRIVKQN